MLKYQSADIGPDIGTQPKPALDEEALDAIIPAPVYMALKDARTLTDEMRFVDVQFALRSIHAREEWFRSIMAKPRYHPVPHAVQIEFTQRCNLTCDFCYNDSGPKNRDELDLETLDRLCSEIVALGTGEVIISGGEPLMKPRHMDLLLSRIGDAGIPIHVLTNGLLLNREWLEKFHRAGVVTVQVSLDGGDAAIHDRIRGRAGAWATSLEALAMAHAAGFHTFVSTVLTRDNVHTLPDLVEAAYLCGCDNLNIGDLITWGRGDAFMENSLQSGGACTNEQFDDAADYLIRQAEMLEGRMAVRLAVNMYFFICQLKLKGQESILIRGDGSVRPHCTLSGIIAGNIHETPLQSIWEEQLSRIHENPLLDDILAAHVPVATKRLRQLRCYRRLPS